MENADASATTGESNPQDTTRTQASAAPAIAGPNPVVPTTSHHAPLEEQITSAPTERPSGRTREQAPPHREIHTVHREARPEAGPSFITQAADPYRTLAGSSKPAGKTGKTRPRGKDNFPVGTPSPHYSIDQWIQFIHRWQLRNEGAQRAFPGVTWHPARVDDSKDEAPELFARNVRGLLLAECLMPPMEYNIGRVGWRRSLVWLLGVAGRYHSIIDWAGLAPAVGQTAEWVGPCESAVYTLPRLAAYLAANGVTYHDADNA